MRAANVSGAGLGLLGLYFLVLPSGIGAVNRGDLLTLFGAMAFAVHIVLVGTYTRRFSFLHLAPGQILVVGIIATLAVPFGALLDPALDWPLGIRHRRDRNFRHRLCLWHSGVGTAVHSAGAYGLDFCPGTRVRRSDFARRNQRTPGGKGAPGFRAHFGGDGHFGGVGRGSAGSSRGVDVPDAITACAGRSVASTLFRHCPNFRRSAGFQRLESPGWRRYVQIRTLPVFSQSGETCFVVYTLE